MLSKEEVGRRIRSWGESHFRSMAEFARALGFNSTQHLYVYLRGKAYPGFELLDRLRKLGMDVGRLFADGGSAGAPSVAETASHYASNGEIEFRSKQERAEVERAVGALVQLAYSYFEYADEETTADLKAVFTRAELERYRRREERSGPVGLLTDLAKEVSFRKRGVRGKDLDVELMIRHALRDAGPPPEATFRPTWDVRLRVTEDVDRFFRERGQAISTDERQRLIDALVLMEERKFSAQMNPKKTHNKEP